MRARRLTGRVRYRKALFGKIVVQVEERGVATIRRHNGDVGYAETVARWRDARAGDLFNQAMTEPWLSGCVAR